MLAKPINEADLEPRIISMGTSRVLRVKQVGAVFFVENNVGHIDDAGKLHEDWKIVAVSKGPEGYKESHQFMAQANGDVVKMMAADLARHNTRHARPA